MIASLKDYLSIADSTLVSVVCLILIGAIVSYLKQWWVTGWQYRQLERERDLWRSLALRGSDLTEKAVSISESIANKVTNGH